MQRPYIHGIVRSNFGTHEECVGASIPSLATRPSQRLIRDLLLLRMGGLPGSLADLRLTRNSALADMDENDPNSVARRMKWMGKENLCGFSVSAVIEPLLRFTPTV